MDGKGGEGGREWSQTKSLVDNGGKLFLGSQNGPTIKPFAVLQQITAEPTSPVGWQAATLLENRLFLVGQTCRQQDTCTFTEESYSGGDKVSKGP